MPASSSQLHSGVPTNREILEIGRGSIASYWLMSGDEEITIYITSTDQVSTTCEMVGDRRLDKAGMAGIFR